jgi:hypothetical protein
MTVREEGGTHPTPPGTEAMVPGAGSQPGHEKTRQTCLSG